MILLSPWLLLGLLALPALWFLVRATPPSPRPERFPSLMLLKRLHPAREDAARAPLWLLLLRIAAVALVILGLARPVLRSSESAVSGPLVLVLDDGWAAIPHWNERRAAALALGQAALHNGGPVTILHAARAPDGAMPEPFTTRDAPALADRLARIAPQPWPVDRAGLAALLRGMDLRESRVTVLSDGAASAADGALRDALKPARAVRDMRWSACDVLRLAASPGEDGVFRARADALPCSAATGAKRSLTVRAVAGNGGTLAAFTLAPGAETPLPLPAMLRNQLDRFVLDGTPGPAGTVLLGAAGHRRPVGVLHTPGDNTPLVGSAFFLDRALDLFAERRTGDAAGLLEAPLSVLVATDGALSGEQTRARVLAWVRHGGMLVRFAGPGLAAEPQAVGSGADPLLPVPLMDGSRELGGPMSWGKPQVLEAFPPASPFADLAVPPDVTVSRQVLARPEAGLSDHVWAALADGTPLVTARAEGAGEVVLFHVTASPDWSNLPLSGLFPQMLERLVQRSAGVAGGGGPEELAPWRILDAQGALVPPPEAARAIRAQALSRTAADVTHPAGLYGPASGTRPLNLADNASPLAAEEPLGTIVTPQGARPEIPLAPYLLGAGLALLVLDLALSLRRRGLLGRIAVAAAALCLALPAHAQEPPAVPAVPPGVPGAALETRLAYVLTGHDDIDTISREGLQGLSDYTSARSSAALGRPDGVTPGKDDLAFYPLLYWPVTPDAEADEKRTKALNSFMDHGGILLIDEQGAGTEIDGGTGSAAREALRRVTDGLVIPPLAKLTGTHVLGHTFYLLHNGFPGRIDGQPVYVARTGDEANDDVSPVIIGNGDWARAWAVDASGNHPFAVLPGGEDQRTQAYRFGVNMVLYALTGSYKNDQARYPEMLRRLGHPDEDQADRPKDGEDDSP